MAPHLAAPPFPVPPDDPRLPAIRIEVAARLRAVCGAIPEDAFDRLVQDVAIFRLRWDEPRRDRRDA